MGVMGEERGEYNWKEEVGSYKGRQWKRKEGNQERRVCKVRARKGGRVMEWGEGKKVENKEKIEDREKGMSK